MTMPRKFDTAMQRIDDCLRYNGSKGYRQGLVNLAMCSMAAWALGIEDSWDEIRYPNFPTNAPPVYL